MNDLSIQLAAALPNGSGFGPDWFRALRDTGAEQFRKHGLPTRRDEAWKYTGLTSLEQSGLQLASTPGSFDSGSTHSAALVSAPCQLKMLDGQVQGIDGKLPEGLNILSLADALENGFRGLQRLLESLPSERVSGTSSEGFSALNTATLESGVVIHVAEGADGGRLLMNWSSHPGEVALLFNMRLCVILEKGAKFELVEQFESHQGNINASNVVLQAELEENSSFQHVRFQAEPENATLITRTEVSQQSGSEYAYFGFDLGGGLVRHDLHSSLNGEGAKSALNGAYLLDGKRHVDNHARVDHKAAGGFSEQYFRGVAGGSGRAVFNTAVCVHPGADETEARQSNGNILLSTRAEVDTKPELEIYADEVVASHGATVGQLDELAIFYLRSRGLTEHEARQMLTTAFCRSVSDKLDDQALGEVISERMMEVMPQAE
jgi:Fe-S cluster assembly protein SufD